MSKLSRDELKSIVKECLVEILSEGLVSSSSKIAESKSLRQALPRPAMANKMPDQAEFRRKLAENTRVGPASQVNTHAQTIARVTSDPILADILADTANTTLVQMIQAEKNPGLASLREGSVDQATLKVANSDPADLFEGAGNWANLAFMPKRGGPI